MEATRRGFLSLLAAPAIIRIAGIMPVRAPRLIVPTFGTSAVERAWPDQYSYTLWWEREALAWLSRPPKLQAMLTAPKGDTIKIRRPSLFTEGAA